MIIGVDIDDTLISTRELQVIKWREYIRRYPNPNYNEILPPNINHFGDPYIDRFWDEYREELFGTELKPGAAEALMHLRSLGNMVEIITSRPKSKYDNLEERIYNLCRDNGLMVDGIATDIGDKALYCKSFKIDILIDDDIRHIMAANKEEIYTILFNEDPRYFGMQLTNWSSIDKILTKVTDPNYYHEKTLSLLK